MKNLILKLKKDPRVLNSLWMFIEKGISLFGLIFIVSAVAKYTGPSIYGEISLAASIFIVLKTFSQLGLDQIYFKYVSSCKPFYNVFLFNSIGLISIIFISIYILVIFWALYFTTITGFWFVIATGIAYYFNAIDLFNYFNEAKLLSRINVFANLTGLIVALILRYIVVFFNMPVLYLCIPIVLMTLIPLIIKICFLKNSLSIPKKFKVKKYYGYFLKAGIPLTLSILTVAFNAQIANYLLAYYYDTATVAIYSIAFVLAGAWCIIPTTIIMSFLTSIYATNNQQEYVLLARKLFYSIIAISFFLIITLIFLSDIIINTLYGVEFKESILVLKILLLYQFFWVIGFYFSRLIVKFNGFKFLAYKSIFTNIMNLILSIIFIKKYSVFGAAIAVLITEIFSSVVINVFYGKAKIFKILNPLSGIKL